MLGVEVLYDGLTYEGTSLDKDGGIPEAMVTSSW